MGMSWSRLVPLSLREMCLELDQVRSQVRSSAFPKGCTLSDVRFLTHVRSQNLAQTNSVPVKVDLSAATYPIRALNVETVPPPLKKQCLYVRDDQWFRPIHLESGHAMELYELRGVRSSCGSTESEQPITLREWTKRFSHYDITKVEIMKLHLVFTRFLQVIQRDGHAVPDTLMEPDVYPSHFALRYKLKQESESDPKGMHKAGEWQPPSHENYDKQVIFCGEGIQVYHGTELGVSPGILNQGALLRRQDELPGQNKEEVLGPTHSMSLEGAFHYAPFVELDLSDYDVDKVLPSMQVVFGSTVRRYVPRKEFGIITKEHWGTLNEIVVRSPSLGDKVQSDFSVGMGPMFCL